MLPALVPLGCSTAPPAATAPAAPTLQRIADADWSDEILYFVIVDRFADGDPANDANVDRSAKGAFHGGDLAGLRQHLDEIADLGVTAIWITPVVRNIPGFVTGAGFPDWGYHGYWADDFNSVDPRFGTEEELRQLVAACHAKGIKVLLDVVYNHAGYNSRYLTDPKTKGWFRSEELGTCGQGDLTSCVSGLPDFKTELPEVAEYLLSAHLGLAKRTAIDGFRLDTVKHVDHPFWQEHRKRIETEIGKDFFLLGEVWGGDPQVLDPWFAGDEMDAGFDFSFQGSTLGWLQGRGRTIAFDRYLKSRHKIRSGYVVSHFLSSHDVETGMSVLGGDRKLFRLAALLEMTTVGIPMIYYGDEVGRLGGPWPANRSDMPWGGQQVLPGAGMTRDEALRADYKKLISIRRAHPALWKGDYQTLSTDGDLLVFLRRDGAGDGVVVAVNRGEGPAEATVPLPAGWGGRSLKDEWNGAAVAVDGAALRIAVEGGEARIIAAGGQ